MLNLVDFRAFFSSFLMPCQTKKIHIFWKCENRTRSPLSKSLLSSLWFMVFIWSESQDTKVLKNEVKVRYCAQARVRIIVAAAFAVKRLRIFLNVLIYCLEMYVFPEKTFTRYRISCFLRFYAAGIWNFASAMVNSSSVCMFLFWVFSVSQHFLIKIRGSRSSHKLSWSDFHVNISDWRIICRWLTLPTISLSKYFWTNFSPENYAYKLE